MARKRLGEMLVEAGAISRTELERALSQQAQWKAPLGRILLDLGFITEEKLIKALSVQLNVPIADLDHMEIPGQVLKMVPAEFCQQHGVLPFRVDDKGLFLDVAMVEPLNLDVLENIRVSTRHNIRSYFATYSAMARAMQKYHGLPLLTDDGPAAVFSTGLDAREISPSGYHLAAAAGARVREFGPKTLQTRAVEAIMDSNGSVTAQTVPLDQSDGAAARFEERIKAVEHRLAGVTKQLQQLAAARQDDGKDALNRFATSLKSLASAVTELRAGLAKHDDLIADLSQRTTRNEKFQERDERVLKKLLGLFVDKGLATPDELRRLLEKP